MTDRILLWSSLSNLNFDDPDAGFSFSDRLARENGWSADYARRVIGEYRRFAFLAMIAGHDVTPSDDVDQAWHLHLTYTRHYWGAFAEALGRPLHHHPTRGGAEERAKFITQYEKTLSAYQKAFGEPAPADIWPAARIRFSEAPFMQRVNTQRKYVIDKRLVFAPVAVMAAVGAVVSSVNAQGADIEGGITQLVGDNPAIVIAVAVVIFIILVNIIFKGGRGKGGRDGGGCSSGCGDSGCGGCGGD